jgi:asparagine synthase (glutamine-hydrolysing)
VCGFAGIVNFDGSGVDPFALARMTQRIRHRGPDDEGHVLLPASFTGLATGAGRLPLEFREPGQLAAGATRHSVGLGFRRLSIIDVSAAGHQPMCNEDGTNWIVYNGEFYDSDSYVEELRARGHRFRSDSDTEVILHLYEEHGIEGTLERMNGMFAFALADLARGRLFLVRDRVGIKPLYYAESQGSLVFGSEVKALFEAPNVPRALDAARLSELLQNRYVNAPNTIFAGVKKLEPGSLRVYELDRPGARELRYWSIFERMREPAEASEADYRDGLVRSVERRLRSDVPLGVFLSGGLDSSTICGIVRRDLERELRTFSIEFGESSGVSEAWASREVSQHLGTEHHGIAFDPDLLEVLPTIAWHCEEPIADPALLPTYYLSEFTRRYVTVALSGEGSDETNYGYAGYALGRAGALLRQLPPSLERSTLASLARVSGRAGLPALARFLREPAGEHDREGFVSPAELDRLLRPEVPRGDAARGAWWKRSWRARSVFDARPLIHFHTWLADDLLLKVDKMSMAHSLEVRVPYLDPELLGVVCNIGARDKLAAGETKAVLRSIANAYVPPRIRDRRQHGFLVPLAGVFERDLFANGGAPSRLRQYLEPASALFDPDAVIRQLAPQQRLDARSTTQLWLLTMVGLTMSSFDLSVH